MRFWDEEHTEWEVEGHDIDPHGYMASVDSEELVARVNSLSGHVDLRTVGNILSGIREVLSDTVKETGFDERKLELGLGRLFAPYEG